MSMKEESGGGGTAGWPGRMVPVGGAQVEFLEGRVVEVMAHSHLPPPSGRHETVGDNHSPPVPPPGQSSIHIPQAL